MAECSLFTKEQGRAAGVAVFDDFPVAECPPGGGDGGNAGGNGGLNGIGKREKAVADQYAAGEGVCGGGGGGGWFASVLRRVIARRGGVCFFGGDVHRPYPIHCPAADTDSDSVLDVHGGVAPQCLNDMPCKEQVGALLCRWGGGAAVLGAVVGGAGGFEIIGVQHA